MKNEDKLELCRKYWLGWFKNYIFLQTIIMIQKIASIVVYICYIFLFFFSGGFAFLPFLWFINSIWFFRDAFLAESFEQQKQIKSCKKKN